MTFDSKVKANILKICLYYFKVDVSDLYLVHWLSQSELPRPIPRNSAESDHGCTSSIYFYNAGDNVTLTSQKPC